MPDTSVEPDTLLARGGHEADPPTGAVVPPLHLSTTFARNEHYELPANFIYGRYGSPTVAVAEALLRDLDGGADAMLFSAGLAATAALLETVRAGERVVAPRVMYHGAQDWMRRVAETRGVELVLFDAAREGALAEAVGSRAGLVWIESPINPTWDVIDIAEAAAIAHGAGAVLAVDSTVAPPVTTRALGHGADIVFHSVTKYMNGHSDVLGGVLVAREQGPLWEELRLIRRLTGSVMAPFDAWLLMRGLRTLAVRFDRCSSTALQIARHFEGHRAVEAVLYPGLESHAGHTVARRQMTRGFGGMFSLLIRGDADAARRLAVGLTLFTTATSFGGPESLVEHRASVEGPHSVVPKNLLRFSVGLESARDLINDLESALAGSNTGGTS